MYAVIRKWKADASRIDESVRKIEEGFVPDLDKVEGFVAYYLLRGEGDDAFTVTICQDREGVEETTRLSRAFVEREMQGIIRGPPEVSAGEVLIERTAERAKPSRAGREAERRQ